MYVVGSCSRGPPVKEKTQVNQGFLPTSCNFADAHGIGVPMVQLFFADAEECMDSLDSLLAEVEVRRYTTVNIARAALGSRPALAAQGGIHK